MRKSIKNFNSFLNEYWGSSTPGTVVVPGDWYKDSVNSRNYKSFTTTMPHVVDPILEDSEFISMIDNMRNDPELLEKIKGSDDPLKILDIIEKFIKSQRSK